MPKSTKTTKIQFARIRQTRVDYLKYFIVKKLKLASLASFSFLFGILLTLNISAVFAQPAANPPGGNVNAGFNNVGIVGNLSNPTPGIASPFDTPILVNDAFRVVGPTRLENSLNLWGLISNTSNQNGGRVLINDEVDIRGAIVNSTASADFFGEPVRINDTLNVTGTITASAGVNTTGGGIGSFYTNLQTFNDQTGNTWAAVSCRPNHKLTGCNSYIQEAANNPTNASAAIIVSTPANNGTNTCNSAVGTKTYTTVNGAVRISSASNAGVRYNHYVTATCFDPTGSQ